MAGDVGDPVRLPDLSFGIDQVGPALGIFGRWLLGRALGLVSRTGHAFGVRQQTEGEAVLFGECPVVPGSVERYADHLHAEAFELRGSIPAPPPPRGPTRGQVL